MFPDLTRDDVFRIETRRLWLRWPRARDVADFSRLAGDEAVAGMTTCLSAPFRADEAEDFILGSRSANVDGRGLVLALSPRGDPAALIGMAGLMAEGDGDDLMLGYWLGRPYWGQGLMSEAVDAVVDMAFLLTDASRMRSPLREGNLAGRKVLARSGFPLPDEDSSGVEPGRGDERFRMASITRDAWIAARASSAGRIARHPALARDAR